MISPIVHMIDSLASKGGVYRCTQLNCEYTYETVREVMRV